MTRVRILGLFILAALVIGGLMVLPAPSQAAPTDYDCTTATGVPQSECEALVAIYNATGGDAWTNDTDWLQTTTPCTWYGITCATEHVTQVNLYENQLNGEIPSEIGNLTNLTNLRLGRNNLSGAIPAEIGNLTQLTSLGLHVNNLSGTIPPEIWELTNLTGLYLWDNQLSGGIPSEIGNLTNLMALALGGNQLSGSIPAEVGNLTALTSFQIQSNQFSGAIPPEIGNPTNLVSLYLNDNLLYGSIPPEIGNLTNLTRLNLGYNSLSGAIPPEIGSLTNLDQLYLYDNALTALPPEIGNLINLTLLDLEYNELTALPAEIGDLASLEELYLYSNGLTTLPAEIGNLTNLWTLDLGGNELTALPAEIGNLASLEELYLHANELTALPAEIGNLTNLYWFPLGNNNLTTLPAEIGNLSNLEFLQLAENNLSSLPVEMSNLTNLGSLRLHGNPLTGQIPEAFTSLNQLYTFTFYETGWCVPETEIFSTWLAGISYLYGTGLICGQTGGQLSGTVTDPDDNPMAAVPVNLYRSTYWPKWSYITTTLTTAAGTYQFDDLGQGVGIDYRVQFADPTHTYAPTYYDNQPTIDLATPITLTVGVPRTGIDAQLSLPQPPAAIIETEGGSVTTNPLDGTATINMPTGNTADITVTRVVTCTTGSPTDVTLILTPPGSPYTMTSIGGEQYQATIPAADITSDSEIVVAATCDSNTTTITVGHINLYDPSGIISDAATGQPVEGATVTLYQVPGWEPKTSPDDDRPNTCESNVSKDEGAPWSQPAPTDLGVLVDPQVTQVEPALSYQLTDSEGYYGWDVGEGCWYVEVVAAGYEPFTSPVVGVPPEVTDLDLGLTKVASANQIFLPLVIR